eukprot:CAMPEP_0176371566 /NCGR_PEP_ID=MMETSP0126-20121128/24786_1 /TAXON_ID=141414 ORGANISM="Strombidinopsis acuminatum, Strain SPMC142" /NCGR_SAMPLE_ID=MMETSP0126 /ASSEMBLY_ACC=CAM_ASM_000229 /LENGTH=175 /DNA_ID=CAMNT_0017731071 /DNA_START=2433 /DNA_END=2960 /DNA_ORIENTATION=-
MLLNGQYSEIDEYWISDIGAIIYGTMVTNIFWPVIEWFMYYGMRFAYRMWDQRKLWPNDPERTHTKTVNAFADLYSGAVFYVHYKYSTLLNIAFVCLFYGSIMPLLFFVGLFSYFVFYTVERLVLAYSYRRPPMYSNEITESCIKTLLTCPVLYCILATWVLTNQQVFQNKTEKI